MAETVKGINADSVTSWLVENVPNVKAPFTFSIIVGGHSNLTYSVRDAAGRHLVLRRPPVGALLKTAHDMEREHRIVSALAPTDVPVPPALGLCEDESVNDAPFYIMEFVEGHVLDSGESVTENFALEHRAGIGESVIEVLIALHNVEPDDVGLGKLGRRDGYLERQIKRWTRQWTDSKTRELESMEFLADVLARNMPEQQRSTIAHGDYRLGNMITGADGKIAAVLDWELCTLGDPLADLGYLLNNWTEPGEGGPTAQLGSGPPTTVPGFPTRSHLVARYEEATGLDTSKIDYYRAFQHWRLAAIVEGVLARYLAGKMVDSVDTDSYKLRVEALASSAMELAQGLD